MNSHEGKTSAEGEKQKDIICLTESEISNLTDDITEAHYVRFSWSDIHGIARGITVPVRNAKTFLAKGYHAFAGSIAFGPQSEVCEEIFDSILKNHGVENCLYVPASTKPYALSWLDCQQTTHEVICNAIWIDGSAYSALPRNILCRQVRQLADMGYTLKCAVESEFSVLRQDTLTPISKAYQYASNQHFNSEVKWLYNLEEQLASNGIEVRTMLPEYSAGQYEFTFLPKDALKSADDFYIFRQAIKELARQDDKVVSFMTNIFQHSASNSSHFNHSLWTIDGAKNLFWDDSNVDTNMSDIARYWLGGMLRHFDALTALSCPTPNCFRRLHTTVVPSRPNWSIDNRNMALRIVNLEHDSMRIENRMPSSASNQYLVTAACIAAGIDGIRNKIEPPAVGANEGAPELPHTLAQALKKLQEDDVMVEAFGKEFVDMFVTLKTSVEIKKFGEHNMKKFIEEEVSLERQEYLDII